MSIPPALQSLIFCLMVCACDSRQSDSAQSAEAEYASGAEKFDLTRDELRELTAKAEQGNVEAAFRIGEYFSFARSDRDSAIRWHKVAAEKGHLPSMNALSLHYMGANTEAACARASYWIRELIARSDAQYVSDNFLRDRLTRANWRNGKCQGEPGDGGN